MTKDELMKNLSKITFSDFDWITNFFPVGQNVFFSDSNFNHDQNLLFKINKSDLLEEVKIKKVWERYFLAHTNPLISGPIGASQTDLSICLNSPDFIQNVVYDGVDYFVTFVKKVEDKTTTYTNRFDNNFEFIDLIEELNNFTIVSPLIDDSWVFIKMNDSEKSYKYDIRLKTKSQVSEKLKKVVLLENKIVILASDYKVYVADNNLENLEVYDESTDEKQIANFSHEAFLLSIREGGKTYCCFINEQKNRQNLMNNYFFRLESFDRKLIIGKPIYDNFRSINYYQAPWFIY